MFIELLHITRVCRLRIWHTLIYEREQERAEQKSARQREDRDQREMINVGTPSHSDQTRSWASLQKTRRNKKHHIG